MATNTAGVYRVETEARHGDADFTITVRRTSEFTISPEMELPPDVRSVLISWLDATSNEDIAAASLNELSDPVLSPPAGVGG